MPSAPIARPTGVTGRLDGLVDGSIALFAAWTLAFHVVLAARLGRSIAVLLFALLAVGLLVLRVRRRAEELPADGDRDITDRDLLVGGAAVAGAVLAAIAAVASRSTVFWLLAVVGAALAIVSVMRSRGRPAVRRPTATLEALIVVAIALGFALLTLVIRSPAGDNAYYLNRALHAAQNASAFPLRDTMFGDQIFPTVAPADTVASYEPFIGIASWLSTIDVRTLYLLLIPAFGAFLGVISMWRLIRTARANVPLIATIIASLFLLLQSGTNSWGPLVVGKPFWGKTLLLFVVLPYLWHHSTMYARTGARSSLWRMVLGGVAAVGVSSSGTFLGTLVIAAAMATLVVLVPEGLTRGAALVRGLRGSLAAAYPLGAGAAGSLAMSGLGISYPFRNESALAVWSEGVGKGAELWLVTAVLLVGWLLVRSQRFGLAVGLGVLAVLAVYSPPGLKVIEALGAGSIGSRFMWALPAPVLIGLVADAPLGLRRRAVGWVALAAIAAAVVGLSAGGGRFLLNRREDAAIGRPAWDFDPRALRAAERLVELADGEGVVAAPNRVSMVIPNLSLDVFAVSPRTGYTKNLAPVAGKRFNGGDRQYITRVLDGEANTFSADRFERALERLEVEAVAVPARLNQGALEEALDDAGYEPDEDRGFTYWTRGGSGGTSRSAAERSSGGRRPPDR